MANLTIVNTQPVDLPTNYKSLEDTIGLDLPLDDLIQFGRLDLSSIPNVVPHSFASSNIHTLSTGIRPAHLAQHDTSRVPTPSSSIRN